VGGRDLPVLDLSRAGASRLRCEHEIAVVPGAGHLFEEAGALDDVADLARGWLVRHIKAPGDP
jgi:putative phosphoribosyl transferase